MSYVNIRNNENYENNSNAYILRSTSQIKLMMEKAFCFLPNDEQHTSRGKTNSLKF